jgi:DMSO/TMAO reductase YedYZ heme-binding membrane subunit
MKILRIFQNIIIGLSLFILAYLPLFSGFGDIDSAIVSVLYRISFLAVFFVMMIRPLADIFSSQQWLRKLVVLRKGFGILSASIIVGFMIGDIITPQSQYLMSIFTTEFWSFENYMFFAHLGDITGLILLLTSNNLSMILLKKNWKRIQKLAYVYFYAGGIYEFLASNNIFALVAMVAVAIVVVIAFIINHKK